MFHDGDAIFGYSGLVDLALDCDESAHGAEGYGGGFVYGVYGGGDAFEELPVVDEMAAPVADYPR